jgi:hypothetical protein
MANAMDSEGNPVQQLESSEGVGKVYDLLEEFVGAEYALDDLPAAQSAILSAFEDAVLRDPKKSYEIYSRIYSYFHSRVH